MMRTSTLLTISVFALSLAVPVNAQAGEDRYDAAELKPAVLSRLEDGQARLIRIQDVNHAPTCVDWSITMGAPIYSQAHGSMPASALVAHCSDPDGDTLVLTNPGGSFNFVLQPYQSYLTVPFSVSDGRGGTANATLTIYH